jgi:hypothetical protein
LGASVGSAAAPAGTQEEANECAAFLSGYGVYDEKAIIPFTASFIEELFRQVQVPGDQ